MTALAIAQDRTEWLQWRRAGIGGSDAPAICGEDPFKTPLEIWLDKRGILPLESQDGSDEPRYWGQQLEPLVISRFERDTGLYVVERQSAPVDESRPWLRATIDGFVSDVPQRNVVPTVAFTGWSPLGIFEGKTASRRSADWAEGPPLRAQIQIQHELAVTGLDHAWIAVLLTVPVLRFQVYEIERDPAAIEALLKIEAAFWQRVLDDNPPAASAVDSDSLRRAYSDVDTSGSAVELPAAAAELVAGLKAARKAVKVAEEEAGFYEAQLMQMLRDREVALIDGRPVLTWKAFTKKHTDVDALRAKHPEIAAEFTTERPYRQMRIVERKEEGEAKQ